MNIAIVCTALLGLLLFGLGLNVSLQRRQNRRSIGHDASPVDPLHRAVRAHANTAEYVPFFAVLWAMAYGFWPNLYQVLGGLVALSGVVYMQGRKLRSMSPAQT